MEKQLWLNKENTKSKTLISDILVNFKGDGRRGEGLSFFPRRSAARAFGLLTGLSAGSEAFEVVFALVIFKNALFFVHSKVTLSCR
jgi:hypothetical protein